jgi:hypothetical protein
VTLSDRVWLRVKEVEIKRSVVRSKGGVSLEMLQKQGEIHP